MVALIRPAVVMLVLFTALLGVGYPLAMTGVATLAFPEQAGGSLLVREGEVVGSALLGQSQAFVDAETGRVRPGLFRGRPSAAVVAAGQTIVSGGANLGPTNRALVDRVAADLAQVREENDLASDADVPIDLVTTSGSGVDPHLSPAAADLQVPRVARERRVPEAEVRALVARFTEERTLGVLGEPRVNVTLLNLALEEAAPMAAPETAGA